MTPTRTLPLVVVALHWVGSLVRWPGADHPLPLAEEVAAEASPVLDSWSWFSLPLVSLILVGAVLLLARWLGRYPLFLGLMGLRRFRTLSEDGRERVLAAVRESLERFALPIAVLFLLIHVGVHEAVAGRTSLPWTLGGLLLSMLWFSVLLLTERRRVEGVVRREG